MYICSYIHTHRALNHDINANISPSTGADHTNYPLTDNEYHTCYVTESLFSRRYFFVSMLCTTQIAVTIGLLTLFIEQCYNITQNMVSEIVYMCDYI